jgi:hypothetical protein
MARKLTAIFVLAAAAIASSAMAQVLTYTESTNSDTELAIGYPVPVPVESLTAVQGFRSYASLHAQHQDLLLNNPELTGQVVGTTHLGRDIWAYQLGDADNLNVNGLTEGAALINGGIHAREWAAPEVVTELIEQLVERKDDGHLVQYILENLNTVIVPVNNVDGFIQTQNFPAQVTPTPEGEPTSTEPPQFDQPRDGRMRRKNMLGVDEDLATDADRLLGVDLNRNNAQFFDDGRNSPDPESIVYRGTAPASEPEIQALHAAADLAPLDRVRWYVDAHSFSRVMFVPQPPNPRHNRNSISLVNKVAATTGLTPGIPAYFPVIGQEGTGISGTAEFFSYVHDIPAWTLEIEPPNGFPGVPNAGAFYGGFGVSHDGFILPDSEVERVRDELTTAHILGLYHQAGPPAVVAVRINNAAGAVVYEAEWQNNGDGTRSLNVTTNTPLLADNNQYRVWLAFDKPMRNLQPGNPVVVEYPGQSSIGANPVGTITGTGVSVPLLFQNTAWPLQPGGGPAGFLRYQTDAIVGTFRLSPNLPITNNMQIRLDVLISDMAGLVNDGNPATVVDWSAGGWTGYENSNGVSGDVGGTDSAYVMTVNPLPTPPPPVVPSSGGGGSALFLLLGLLVIAAGSGAALRAGRRGSGSSRRRNRRLLRT